MKKGSKSRQSYVVVWCIMLLSIIIMSCTQQPKFKYPEVEKLCQIYANSHTSGTDTVNYYYKIDTTAADKWQRVEIIGDDGTRVTYDLNYYWHVRRLTEEINGDTIFKYPGQEKLHGYHIDTYIDPVCINARNKQYEGKYQLITSWLIGVSENELSIIYIDKTTSISPNNRITSIRAKIWENGRLRICNDSEMGYESLIDDWMEKDTYYARRVNIEIKKVLNSL